MFEIVILDDPYGSVYLHEGMYEEAIRFLEDRMIQHGGEVDLIAMYDGNDMEGAYLKAALGRLMVTCDFKDIAKYASSVRRMEASHGKVNPELNPLMLNQDLLELIKLDSKEANERIGKKGFFRWQEENKRLGSILEEGVNNFAYGLMMYHTARVEMDALSKSAQQRDVKMPRKAEQQGKANQQGDVKQQGEVKQQGIIKQQGEAKQQGIIKQQGEAKQQGIIKQQGEMKQQGITKQQGEAKQQGIIKQQGEAKQQGNIKKQSEVTWK